MTTLYDQALANMPLPLFTVGERAYWRRIDETGLIVGSAVFGIITDRFVAPITGQYVYVIRGEGFYQDDLLPAMPLPLEDATVNGTRR